MAWDVNKLGELEAKPGDVYRDGNSLILIYQDTEKNNELKNLVFNLREKDQFVGGVSGEDLPKYVESFTNGFLCNLLTDLTGDDSG